MTNIWKFLLIIFVSIFSFVQVKALDAPTWLVLNESSSDSLNISWDAVTDSTGYYVYYSTESWIYDQQVDELIETTNVIINALEASTTYYVSVVSLDSQWVESENSLELETETSASEEIVWDPFSLQSVQVNSFSEIELTFSEALEIHPDASREFKVLNKEDSLDELLVVKTQVNEEDTTKVVLTFDRETLPATEYELTVIDIKSDSGKNIESWIDGISSFSTPNEFEVEEVLEEPIVEDMPVEEGIDFVRWLNTNQTKIALRNTYKNISKLFTLIR